MKQSPHVYFVRAGADGPVKIGLSRDVAKRLTKMQTDTPAKLVLLGVVAGEGEAERALHAELAAYRLNGEWFAPSEEVLAVCHREITARSVPSAVPVKRWHVRPTDSVLRAWRRSNALSMQTVAARVGLTQASLSRLERGKQNPSVRTALKILRATEGAISMDDLFRDAA